jgi:tetratricopeptide (TPR) repeat protein
MAEGHCFISYSTADALDFATKLANELEGSFPYISVWFDKRDLRSEENWDSQLAEAIKTCKCMFFVMSRDSVTENSVCAEEWDWAMRYKKPVVPLRLHADIEVPFRLGRRQWIDFSGEFKAGIAKLRKYIDWLESPEGILQSIKFRLADAERDLRRARPEDQPRVQAEIDDLKAEIRANEVITKDFERAKKQTRKNIDAGLKRDRQPINPMEGKASYKFINPRPGSIPDYFEGRLVETEEIADFLRNDFQRIMIINGRAGSGKTVLACRVLRSLENGEFPNDLGEFQVGGIVYLSTISNYKVNVANVFSGVLQLLEPEKASKVEELYREAKISVDEKIRALLSALAAEPVILLLDNFEDLLDPEDGAISDSELHTALSTILQAESHTLKVLITTRTPPRHLSLIAPAKQYVMHLEEGLPSPFAENVLRKMDRDGHAGLRDATDEVLGNVREATLGYPRALESLYAILRVDRYSNVEELLEEGLPETVVEKFVGEAFSRLDPKSQKILQALAVFNRPVSHAAVDFALQFHLPAINSAPILERLVGMHFARREAKRYFLHPADREYALSRMPQGHRNKKIGQGARARTWDQHCLTLRAADYFVEVRKPRTEWKKLDDLAAQLAEFDLRCTADDYETAANVLIHIDGEYLLLWGHYRLVIQLHERIQEKIRDKWLYGRSIDLLGSTYCNTGQASKAIAFLNKSLQMARENKYQQGEAASLGNLGQAYLVLGDTERAIEYHIQSLTIARRIGARGDEAISLISLGTCYDRLGDVHKAIEFSNEASKIITEIGDQKGIGAVLINLGTFYAELGNTRKAIELYEQALNLARQRGDRPNEEASLSSLGSHYAELGDAYKAIEFLKDALVISREIGSRRSESLQLGNMGVCYLDLEQYQKAKGYCEQSIQIADEISYLELQNHAPCVLALTYLCENELVNAQTNIEAALQYDVPSNNHNVRTLHGIIKLRQADPRAACQIFMSAISQADKVLAKTPELYESLDAKGLALCGLALCADNGQETIDRGKTIEEAVETFQNARKIAPHAGVVKRVLRLFDELGKCDEEGLLKDVRKAIEGKE